MSCQCLYPKRQSLHVWVVSEIYNFTDFRTTHIKVSIWELDITWNKGLSLDISAASSVRSKFFLYKVSVRYFSQNRFATAKGNVSMISTRDIPSHHHVQQYNTKRVNRIHEVKYIQQSDISNHKLNQPYLSQNYRQNFRILIYFKVFIKTRNNIHHSTYRNALCCSELNKGFNIVSLIVCNCKRIKMQEGGQI